MAQDIVYTLMARGPIQKLRPSQVRVQNLVKIVEKCHVCSVVRRATTVTPDHHARNIVSKHVYLSTVD